MSEHSQLVRVTTLHPAEGKRDDVVRVCQENAERARQIEGNFGVQVCSVREEPEWVAIVSRWEDPSAASQLDQLMQQARAANADLLREAPRTYHMTPI